MGKHNKHKAKQRRKERRRLKAQSSTDPFNYEEKTKDK